MRFLKIFTFLQWTVVRGVFMLLEQTAFESVSDLLRDYLNSIFSGVLNSLGIELVFNFLRDNELRAARHKQRGMEKLDALQICQVANSYPELEHIQCIKEDMQHWGRFKMQPKTYQGWHGPRKEEDLGFDLDVLTQTQWWSTTSTDALDLKQFQGFQALVVVGGDGARGGGYLTRN